MRAVSDKRLRECQRIAEGQVGEWLDLPGTASVGVFSREDVESYMSSMYDFKPSLWRRLSAALRSAVAAVLPWRRHASSQPHLRTSPSRPDESLSDEDLAKGSYCWASVEKLYRELASRSRGVRE